MSRRRFRHLSGEGEILAQPPLAEFGSQLERNSGRWDSSISPIAGVSLSDFRKHSQQEILQLACTYLQEQGEPLPPLPTSPTGLIVSGHQPEWFHPGVWAKNFALAGLAKRHNRIALNWIVDNDTVKTTALRVPVLNSKPTETHLVSVPFDRFQGEEPYEERTLHEPPLWKSFEERLGALIQDWPFRPMVETLWPQVCRQLSKTPHLGECFAVIRRRVEREWGCHNLEVPLSRVSGTQSFAKFAGHILQHLPRFSLDYNTSVRSYRRENHVRSKNHPVPDLVQQDDWYEAPFWIWKSGLGGKRGRLFSRLVPQGIEIRTNTGEVYRLPEVESSDYFSAWQTVAEAGWTIRPRALTTTLYSRLALADSFIHGIGGGKYDEVTDRLIQKFFGIEPPEFLVLTATQRLPLPLFPTTKKVQANGWRNLRDRIWNPHQDLDISLVQDPQVQELIQKRASVIQAEPPRFGATPQRKIWFRQLKEIREQLRNYTRQSIENATEQYTRQTQEWQANQLLTRRDFAWCLFPEAKLRPAMQSFLTDV